MKNKKFLKAIATITIGAVASVGCFAAAACSSCNDDEHTHRYGDGYEKTADGHYQICLDCDAHSETETHVYTDDNDTTCNICDYVREVGGNQGGDHQHIWGEAYTSAGADGHYKTCTVEGCNEHSTTEEHTYDSETATTCNKCGYERTLGGEETKTVYDELVAKDNKLYNNDFATDGEVGVHGGYAQAGVYTDKEGYVAIADGALSHVSGKGANSNIIIDFGVLAEGSTVEGYMELNCSAMGSKWNLVRFVGDGGVVFDLRTPANGSSFVYSLDGGTTEAAAEEAVATAKETLYKVYYKIDLSTGKITLTVNGKKIVTELDANITSLKGIYIPSSSSGSRLVTVDNVVFCGTQVSLADYKTDLAGKLDKKAAAMTGEGGTHTSESASTAVSAELTAGKAAIDAAENYADALKAYNAAVAAMNLIPGTAYEDVVAYVHSLFNPANYTNPASKAEYDAEIAKILAQTDMTKLTLPDAENNVEAGETLAEVLDALEAVDTDKAVWADYITDSVEKLQEDIDINEYRINIEEVNSIASTAQAKIKEYDEYESYQAAIDAVDAMIAEITAGIAEIDTDTEVITAAAEELLVEFNAELDDIIAALENPSADLLALIDGMKITVEDLTKDVMDENGDYADETLDGYYVHVLNERAEAALAEIEEAIENALTPVEDARANAITEYDGYKTELLEEVMDEAFATELGADSEAPALGDLMDCTNASQVALRLNERKAEYASWLNGKLAAKTYTVTLNGVLVEGLTVKYGEELNPADLPDPTAKNENLMIDPADSNLYDSDDTAYAFDKVYGNLVLHFNTVEAVTLKYNYEFDWFKIDATSFGDREHGGSTAGDQVYLNQNDLTGVNAFIKPIGNNVIWRSATDTKITGVAHGGVIQCIQNTEAFTVTFSGTGTFVIAVRGGGNTTKTTFYLKDSNGNNVGATYNAAASDTEITADGNVYTMYSKTYQTFTFNVTHSGEYTFCVGAGACRVGALNVNDVNKLPCDVTVSFGDGEAVKYHHSQTITAPTAPQGTEGQKFDGWYCDELKFEGTLNAGEYHFTARFLDPNVIIKLNVNGVETIKKFYLEDGVTITLDTPADKETGEVFGHWSATENGTDEYDLSAITAGTSESPNEITLYAVYISGVAVESVTISGDNTVNVGSVITLTATVSPDDATNKTVNWSITEGNEFATINATTGELTGVAVGTVKVVATAGGVSSGEFTITVEPVAKITSDLIFATGYDGTDSSKLNVTDSKNLLTIVSGSKYTDSTVSETTIGNTTTTNALLSGGKTCDLKAGDKDIIVKLYIANTDSKLAPKSTTISWSNTYDDEDKGDKTYTTTKDSLTAQVITIKIAANTTVTVSAAGNRLVLFGAEISTL